MSGAVVPRARERLIVALDLPALGGALELVRRLDGVAERFKVGLELHTAEGPRAVEAVRAAGGRVFLDLKLHDIPETTRRAARAAAAGGAELITVHAAGGRAMLEAAVAGAREAGGAARVLAVTVLTSLDLADLAAVGTVAPSVAELVVRRALLAREAGCDGVIASPHEATAVRAAAGSGFLIVTPGVRPSTGGDDQKRTATARQAIADGADAVVVGRPIRDAVDPRAAALALLEELA
jgi:orotidine-5'-phosphate decarboxylase